jgi:hypothetical protein
MKPTLVFLIAVVLLILVPALVNAQSPPIPAKSPVPDIPAKSTPFAAPTPFASPQAQIQASPGVGVNAAVARQPNKIKTKQVTRVKRGLFGK